MCTTTRTRKVTVGLTLVALPAGFLSSYQIQLRRYVTVLYVAFLVVLPLTVLIINVLLVREVRRAANNAAANLGLQQHHQSTSSNSAVPTVMLVTTSLVYVFFLSASCISWLAYLLTYSEFSIKCHDILASVSYLVHAYNFFVYFITCKQFRSELRTLLSRCTSSSSSSSVAVAVVYDRNDAGLAAGIAVWNFDADDQRIFNKRTVAEFCFVRKTSNSQQIFLNCRVHILTH